MGQKQATARTHGYVFSQVASGNTLNWISFVPFVIGEIVLGGAVTTSRYLDFTIRQDAGAPAIPTADRVTINWAIVRQRSTT